MQASKSDEEWVRKVEGDEVKEVRLYWALQDFGLRKKLLKGFEDEKFPNLAYIKRISVTTGLKTNWMEIMAEAERQVQVLMLYPQ